jgi:hypothetical protein
MANLTPFHQTLTRARRPLGIAALFALACAEPPLRDLGQTGETIETPPAAVPQPELISDFSGVWIGQAEDVLSNQERPGAPPPLYTFPSGSSRILLDIHLVDGTLGTLTFGEAKPPPPATDPNVGYPPDPNFEPVWNMSNSGQRPPTEGLAYVIHDAGVNGADFNLWARDYPGDDIDFFTQGHVADGKLDLAWDADQLYRPWCELLTPADCDFPLGISSGTGDGCGWLPVIGGELIPIDCLKAQLCLEDRCSFDPGTPARIGGLTLRFTSEGLIGLFSDTGFVNERGYRTQLGTVRFTRVEAAAVSQE